MAGRVWGWMPRGLQVLCRRRERYSGHDGCCAVVSFPGVLGGGLLPLAYLAALFGPFSARSCFRFLVGVVLFWCRRCVSRFCWGGMVVAKKVQRELFREVHAPVGRVKVTPAIRRRSVRLLKLRGSCTAAVAAVRAGVSVSLVRAVWSGRRDPAAPARVSTLTLIGDGAGPDWRPATVIDDQIWRRLFPGNDPGAGVGPGSIVERAASRGLAVVFRAC